MSVSWLELAQFTSGLINTVALRWIHPTDALSLDEALNERLLNRSASV